MKFPLLIASFWLLSVGCAKAQYTNGRRPECIFGRDFYEFKGCERMIFARGNQAFKETDYYHLNASGTGFSLTRAYCLNEYRDCFLLAGIGGSFSVSAPKIIYDVHDICYDWYWERATARVMAATARVPLSIGWQFQFKHHPQVFIMPYVGINTTFYCWGAARIRIENSTNVKHWQNVAFLQSSLWHYDTASNFNMGTHIGFSTSWRHLTAGIEYSYDILPLYKSKNTGQTYSIRTSDVELSIGYTMRVQKREAKTGTKSRDFLKKLFKRRKNEEIEDLI